VPTLETIRDRRLGWNRDWHRWLQVNEHGGAVKLPTKRWKRAQEDSKSDFNHWADF
jgi:hypothetical protein